MLLRSLCRDYRVVILTSCSDVAKSETLRWLDVHDVPGDNLVMRAVDDHRPDTEFKEAVLRKIGLERILCCFEDNFRVARHLRSLGLTVHVVRHYDSPGEHEK